VIIVHTAHEAIELHDAEGFETDEHNNLVVTCTSAGVVFAQGHWKRVEIGPGEGPP